jgi:hypothetical protein
MKEILDQIKQYIEEKQANKTWVAGKDFVNYAGPLFTADEYVAAAESLLNGWLVISIVFFYKVRLIPVLLKHRFSN